MQTDAKCPTAAVACNGSALLWHNSDSACNGLGADNVGGYDGQLKKISRSGRLGSPQVVPDAGMKDGVLPIFPAALAGDGAGIPMLLEPLPATCGLAAAAAAGTLAAAAAPMHCGPETFTDDDALWLVDADLSYLDIGIGPMDIG